GLEPDLVKDAPDYLSGTAQQSFFFRGNLQPDLLHHTLAGDNRGQAKAEVFQAVLPFQKRGDGQDRMLVPEDTLGDINHGQPDPVISCPLPFNHFVGGIFNLFKNLLSLEGAAIPVTGRAVIGKTDTGDVGQAPDGHLAVAVFPQDIGVDVCRVNLAMAAEEETEAGSIQNRPGTNHPLLLKPG